MSKREADGTIVVIREAIHFISGKYKGKNGWLDPSKEGNEEITPVIVQLGRGKGTKKTFVYNSSFKKVSVAKPTSYTAAAMQQHPEVEDAIIHACRLLARCDIRRDQRGFQAIIQQHINDAIKWQDAKGPSATYKMVRYGRFVDE